MTDHDRAQRLAGLRVWAHDVSRGLRMAPAWHREDVVFLLAEIDRLSAAPVQETAAPDVVCQHGTALDVHCCNCHSGFIFDKDHECPPAQSPGSPLPLEHSRACSASFADDACTCGLSWRIRLVTEQELHAAWRKRAEEAEAREAAAPTLRAQIDTLRKREMHDRYNTVAMFEQAAWNSALDAVLALLPTPEKE